MTRQLSRRRFAQLTTIALVGVAGCGSPGEEEDGEDEADGEDGGEEEDDALREPRTR